MDTKKSKLMMTAKILFATIASLIYAVAAPVVLVVSSPIWLMLAKKDMDEKAELLGRSVFTALLYALTALVFTVFSSIDHMIFAQAGLGAISLYFFGYWWFSPSMLWFHILVEWD